MEKESYTILEAAKKIGVTRRTMYNYLINGQIEATKSGKLWIIPAESIKDFKSGKRIRKAAAEEAERKQLTRGELLLQVKELTAQVNELKAENEKLKKASR